MARPELLFEVKIQETDKNSVIYRGRMSGGNFSSRAQGCDVSSDSDWYFPAPSKTKNHSITTMIRWPLVEKSLLIILMFRLRYCITCIKIFNKHIGLTKKNLLPLKWVISEAESFHFKWRIDDNNIQVHHAPWYMTFCLLSKGIILLFFDITDRADKFSIIHLIHVIIDQTLMPFTWNFVYVF